MRLLLSVCSLRTRFDQIHPARTNGKMVIANGKMVIAGRVRDFGVSDVLEKRRERETDKEKTVHTPLLTLDTVDNLEEIGLYWLVNSRCYRLGRYRSIHY